MPFDGRAVTLFQWDSDATSISAADIKAYVRSFTVDSGQRLENLTAIGDAAARYEAVKKDASVQAEIRLETATAVADDTFDALTRGGTGTLTITWPATGATGSTAKTFTWTCIMETPQFRYDEDTGVQVGSVTWRGRGADPVWS